MTSTESLVQVEGNYVDGQREGRWVWTYLSQKCSYFGYKGPSADCARPEGTAWAGNYRGGRREGLWISFHREGRVESQGEYLRDEKEGVWRYFSFEGKPSEVISCHSGRAHGPYSAWQEFDVPHVSAPLHHIFLRGAFRDGQPIGVWWRSYPGERPQKFVCKLDDYCAAPVELWSDLSDGCETAEFQLK